MGFSFGGSALTNMHSNMPTTHTTRPIVTGTSVIGITYKGGVMLAADTLGSYGSLSRFKKQTRIKAIGDQILIGAGGDLSDWQQIEETLDEFMVDDICHDDGANITAPEMHSFLGRVLYNRRTKMNPYWSSLLVAGVVNDKPFLGTVDRLGNSYTGDHLATGFGQHLAIPLLRKHWKPDMTRAEAQKLIDTCMRVLFYRDCRTLNRITTGVIEAGRPGEVREPYKLDTKGFQGLCETKVGCRILVISP